MIPLPIDYQIYHGQPLSLPINKSYSYLMAGNGIFKYAINKHIEALIQIAPCHIAGLPDLAPYAFLRSNNRIPGDMLTYIKYDATRDLSREWMYHMIIKNGLIVIQKPLQETTAAHISYEGGGDLNIVCDLHSHGKLPAFFSSTDNRDEVDFRFYAVVGNLHQIPQIAVRLGIYGDWWRIPATSLFSHLGQFEDVHD